MFQSYEFQEFLGTDPETKQSRWQYKIIDSDFEEVEVGVSVWFGVGVSVIETYEKRNLRVAPNLIAAIFYFHKQYPDYSIQEIIEANRKYNPKFSLYEKEVLARLEKILPLL